MTMDSDYSYIYTFIQYLKMILDLIIDEFKKLSSSSTETTTTTTEAAEG